MSPHTLSGKYTTNVSPAMDQRGELGRSVFPMYNAETHANPGLNTVEIQFNPDELTAKKTMQSKSTI